MVSPEPKSPTETLHGGVVFPRYLLGEQVKAITTKTGERKCVISLRDPVRLSNSVTIWLNGEPGPVLEAAAPGQTVSLQAESVRSGRSRGELIATVNRVAVEAAFARSGGVS